MNADVFPDVTSTMTSHTIFVSLSIVSLLLPVFGGLGEECIGMTCQNGGTLFTDNGDCRCSCPRNTSGFLCQYNLKQSNFPRGPFALPMSKDGCPEGPARGWEEGYINITTMLPLDDVMSYPESCRGFVRDWLSMMEPNQTRLETNTLGPFSRFSVQMNFCSKRYNHFEFVGEPEWPNGHYGVYGTNSGCPVGFATLNVTLCLPPLLLYNMDGHVPLISIEENNGFTELTLTYCKRQDETVESEDTNWKSFNPFLLLKDPDQHPCPEAMGYHITDEHIPVPLPAKISRPDMTSNMTSFFQLSSCHVVSKQYGFITGPDEDNFLPLWAFTDSPGKGHIWMDGRLESRYCGDFTIGPSITDCSQEETWVLIDAQRNVLMSAVVFDLTLLADSEYGEMTHIFVGTERWSFFNHGARVCQYRRHSLASYREQNVFRCYRSQYGRYVTVVYRTNKISSFEKMRYSNTMVSIFSYDIDKVTVENATDVYPNITKEILTVLEFTDVATESCGQELGIHDFGVRDGQITASSWSRHHFPAEVRPQYSGWCSDRNDPSPYIQIDLIFITVVDGLVLFNWEEVTVTVENNIYKKTVLPRGSASLRLEYGVTLDTLKLYGQKDFVYDLSQAHSIPQTFQFVTPFLARYVRVRPNAFPGSDATCLKFELLGCRKYVSTDCDTSTTKTIVDSASLYVPRRHYTFDYLPLLSSNTECQETCFKNESRCLATSFQEDGTCTLYLNDQSKDYIELTSTLNRTMLMSAVVCLADVDREEYTMKYQMLYDGFLYPSFERTTYYVNYTGVLTSPWYPLMYSYNSVYRWTIHLPEIAYVLQFTNISLREYEDYDGNALLRCRDTIVMSALHEQLLTNPYSNALKSTWEGDPYQFFQSHINSTYNGRTPSFPRMQKASEAFLQGLTSDDFHIELIACSTTPPVTNYGSGFRLHITESEDQICQTDGSQSICFLPRMEIRTPSFNGLFDERDSMMWQIVLGSGYVYATDADFDSLVMTINFEDFDISCNSESIFSIHGEFVDGTLKYCNKNKPAGDQYYISGAKYINYKKFQNSLLAGQMFREGFRLSYKYIPRYKSLPEMFSIDEASEMEWQSFGGSYPKKLCSEKFKKCYTLDLMPQMSWMKAAEYCQESNMLLVNTKTLQELEFVRMLVTAYRRDLRFVMEFLLISSDFYIGLRRYLDSAGIWHEHWTDGTPLTFTAWKTGQPKDVLINKCTKMHFEQPDNMMYMNTTSCTQDSEFREMVVCSHETDVNKQNSKAAYNVSNPTSYRTDTILSLPKNPTTLFWCANGELVSRLARCNGIPECADSSDETNCSVATESCGDDEFTCTNGLCIHVSQVCDFTVDCVDNSDEYCVFQSCVEGQFRCTSGQCIPEEDRCDSQSHCTDNSDEINCDQCNLERAFQCGDASCIHKRLVCDKHVDCPDGADERSCDRKYTRCDELWRDGYTENGYFELDDGYTIHCDFNDVKNPYKENVIKMTFMNIDWRQITESEYIVEVPGIHALLFKGYACSQKFSERPHRERLVVMNLNNITVQEDELKIWVFATGDVEESPTGTYVVERNKEPDGSVQEVKLIINDNFNYMDNTIVIGKVECLHNLAYDQIDTQETILCGKGVNPVKQTDRCLHNKDVNGRAISGCRSLTHLQNCENFTCPEDYFKCPDSYCIPAMLVCNGRIDCNGGEDELYCGCNPENRRNIVILIPDFEGRFPERVDKLFRLAFELGGLLYTHGSIIKVLRLERKPVFENLNYFIGNRVLSNSEHVADILHTYGGSFNESLEQVLFDKSDYQIRGVIWLSDELEISETEMEIISTNMSVSFHSYRLVINEHAQKNFELKEQPQRMEIVVRNSEFVRTIGARFLPHLCNETLSPCVNQYRCRHSKVCIPFNQVCDATVHCPHGDDEKHCRFQCPDYCTCKTFVIICRNLHSRQLLDFSSSTRILDLSNTSYLGKDVLIFHEVKRNLPYLLHLNLSMCDILSINSESFKFLDNLLLLDISFNKFTEITTNSFANLKFLQQLFLHGNYHLRVIQPGAFNGLTIKSLAVNDADINSLEANTFAGLILTDLDLSNSNIQLIQDAAFNSLFSENINIKGNPIKEFSKGIFLGVEGLVHLKTPAYKFCCVRPAYMPESSCLPYRDEFSSCKDLMRDSVLQALLWVIGILAFIGNIISVIYRLIYDRKRMKLGYGVFVTNLALADLLMGFYMLMIAIADRVFRDRYIEMDDYWRNSFWCKLAGVLSTVSSEASVIFMCLITIDRILVIKYPFGQVRFKSRYAYIAVACCWVFVTFISVLPFMYTAYFQDEFYSRSAVCLALPLTRERPAGWLYSIVIFIGFNFTTFVLIAVGQWLIYMDIKKQSSVKKTMNVSRSNDLKVARNLLLVVTTDFLCWFPVGLMGIMALSGLTIPGDVYAWTAVLVLPVNSALNPFLYTLTAVIGKENFNPSVDEQERSDLFREVGNSILKILSYVSIKKNGKSLKSVLGVQKLGVASVTRLFYQVTKFVDLLHRHDISVGKMDEGNLYVSVTKHGSIGDVKYITLPTGMKIHTRQKVLADDIYQIGRMLDKILGNMDVSENTHL